MEPSFQSQSPPPMLKSPDSTEDHHHFTVEETVSLPISREESLRLRLQTHPDRPLPLLLSSEKPSVSGNNSAILSLEQLSEWTSSLLRRKPEPKTQKKHSRQSSPLKKLDDWDKHRPKRQSKRMLFHRRSTSAPSNNHRAVASPVSREQGMVIKQDFHTQAMYSLENNNQESGSAGGIINMADRMIGRVAESSAHSSMQHMRPLTGVKWYEPERWARAVALFYRANRHWLRPLLMFALACGIVFVIAPACLALLA